jgi:hypothetical protein
MDTILPFYLVVKQKNAGTMRLSAIPTFAFIFLFAIANQLHYQLSYIRILHLTTI